MEITLGITIIVLQIICGLLSGYLLNYVNQRGKNWADKKDLKAITDIVEDVKQKYQADNERLRAELTVISNRKTKDFSDEKESVILFYTAVNEWLWDKTNILIVNYDRDNYRDLSQKIVDLNAIYNQTNVLFSKMQLLVDNRELTDKGHELIIEALKFHQYVETHASNLLNNLISEKALMESFVNKGIEHDFAPGHFRQIMSERAKGLAEEKKAIFDDFNAKKVDLFKIPMDVRHQFENLAKQHLKT